jgi:hypothetical protein
MKLYMKLEVLHLSLSDLIYSAFFFFPFGSLVSGLSEFLVSLLHVLAFRAGAVWMASCVHAIPTSINWFGVLFSTPHPIPLLLNPISLPLQSFLVVACFEHAELDLRLS